MTAKTARFLVDFNVGRAVADYLHDAGYDIMFIGDVDPRTDDSAILDIATSTQRIVVTMDTDFGELVYRLGKPHIGVLLLRMPDANRHEKIQAITQILAQHLDKLAGHFCVYQKGRLRVRP